MQITDEAVHDIRNVLASIKAYIQIAARRIEKNNITESRTYLSKIEEKTDVLISMLQVDTSQKGK